MLHSGYFLVSDIMRHFEIRKTEDMKDEDRDLAAALDELSIVQVSELVTEPKLDADGVE